ncbi:MAG: VapE domain-containing protein, partial [Burkholderiaceae bacterium]
IIVGSTNRDTGFLIDDTGNRRFWVIPVDVEGMIEVDGLLLERDAIWSAAVAAYRAGEANHLPREQERQVSEANLAYLVESPWLAPVREWLSAPRNAGIPITTEVLLTDAIGKPVERQSRADQMQIASILRELGLNKRRAMVGGTQKWVYLPTSQLR